MPTLKLKEIRCSITRAMPLILAVLGLSLLLQAQAFAQQTKPAGVDSAAPAKQTAPARTTDGADTTKAKAASPSPGAEGPPGAAVRQSEVIRSIETPASLSAGQVGNPGRSYLLGAGDTVRVTVFQQPDMATETRVSDAGTLTFPLLGAVEVSGLSAKQIEQKIGGLLKARGFVRDPQVTVTVSQFRSKQISVLGHVNRPGRYALEEGAYNLTDILALAGGTAPDASDTVILVRMREGKTITLEVNIPLLFHSNGALVSPEVIGGDTIFVDRYPYFYIYGEVQRPGVYRLENRLSVMQALSLGGGFTMRAAKGSIQINRRDKDGKIKSFIAQYDDLLMPDDVMFIKESLF